MKALVRDRYGGPEVLAVREIPAPVPAPDQVLVRVHAASLNLADVDFLKGVPMARLSAPFRPAARVLGSDVAGRVEAIGSKVTLFEPGDEVYGDTFENGFGGFAELVAVPEEKVSPIPLGLTAAQASTLPQAGLLAWQGLTGWGGVKPRQRVLINGGGGGAGTFAIQIAKALGAVVTGVDSAAKLELMRSLGADEVIDYAEDDFTDTEESYHRVLDMVLSRSMGDAHRSLTSKGLYVVVGAPLQRLLSVVSAGTVRSATSGAQIRLLMWRSMDRVDMARLESVVAEGTIRPVIEGEYLLDGAPAAFERLAAGDALGKLVVTVARDDEQAPAVLDPGNA
jgi:NADPH:quinone reductase-like Zn-dependent oxidoreductase